MQRSSREQYAAMCARAQATGQPLPAYVFAHVSLTHARAVREAVAVPPPAKRPNKHPAPMQQPSREQYAAMCARAQATGQPLPAHVFAHVSLIHARAVREAVAVPPPVKRPNMHPASMQQPSREQYAAKYAHAQATGQPLPAHVFAHVSLTHARAVREAVAVPPPVKRPNMHPASMQQPSREQYAVMCARAQAIGQPLPAHVTDDIGLGMENSRLTVRTLLDFSYAFNTVDFDVLIAVLRSLNISPTVIDWFHSYLYGRAGAIREAVAAPPPAKRPNKHPAPMQRPSREQYAAMCARAQATGQPLPAHVFAHVNGKPTNITGRGGRRHVISWMDAPDDLYFRATDTAKVARRTLSCGELRRGARAPWRAMRSGAGAAAAAAAAGAVLATAGAGAGAGAPTGAGKTAGAGAPLQLVILD
ncbi:hypothetical protein evm_001343 [Chilo suppressalis]|nr:hypothetical protein evm_001343 [Chilo suppressalis]